jgi:hypothetical protein
MDDWRVMDWKGRTQAQRSDTCRNFFVNHARRVTGSDDIRGVLGLFGARLEFEQENFDAYDCKGMSEGMKAHGGCVETTNLADELKQYYTDGAAQQQFAVVDGAAGSGTALQFNAEMKEAYEKSVSFDPTASTTDKIKGRKLFMEVLLAAHEELMMREIMRGGVATGLKSATLQFSTATKDMMDCDCFINDDAIFVCDPAPWVPDSMHGQYADHALVLIGWGEQAGVPYWIGKNSWGTAWGDSGYFKIRRGVNSCLVELAHPVTAEPDLVSMEQQTLQLSRNLFREHSESCSRCTFYQDKMQCTTLGSAVNATVTKKCESDFKGSTNRWDRWNCQKGGYFNPALIRSRVSCVVSSSINKVNTKGEHGITEITASEPVDGTNLPLCATRLTRAECTAFEFTDKAGVTHLSPCEWRKPDPQIPCTCLYPYANDDDAARRKNVFATNDAYANDSFEYNLKHTSTKSVFKKDHPYHQNLQGCTKCAPRCANNGTVDTTDPNNPCRCKCKVGFGGDNCEDHLRVECADSTSYPMLHYHLSFPPTPGDYFSSSPGEGTFSLACERRFHLCEATQYDHALKPNGCVCKDAVFGAVDSSSGLPTVTSHGTCKHASKDCFCVQSADGQTADGAMRIDDLSSSGTVTMKYVRFFKGYTHTMADTYHDHSKDTFKVAAQQCKTPTVTDCLAGSYKVLGHAQCHQCPAGRFTNIKNAENCTVCEEGKHTSSEAGGAQECTTCEAGFTTVSQTEREDPPKRGLTRKCQLPAFCTMTIAYAIGVFQHLDKGKHGVCSVYWAKAVKYAVNAGACSRGNIAYQMNDARWGASDSADPMSHAWKSDAVRDCWGPDDDTSIKSRYDKFAEDTAWGPLCDITLADPAGCGLGDRCLDAIGVQFMNNKELAPDYRRPDPEVKSAALFIKQLKSTQTPFATCPQFWEKQISDVMVQTSGEWKYNKATGIWEFVSFDICPVVAAPVWRSPMYRRCWNAIRRLPFSFNGQAFQTPACDPTNQCHPAGESWVKTQPSTGGSCLDVDGNAKIDAFDILAIRIALTLNSTGTVAQKELTAMYSRRQATDSTGALSPAQVLTAIDICKGKSNVHYSVSSADANAKFSALDAKLLMAYVAVTKMPTAAQVAIMGRVCDTTCAGSKALAQSIVDRIAALGNEKFADTDSRMFR